VYSSYLSGRNGDLGYDLAMDEYAHAYVMGTASSTDFPTLNAFQRSLAGNHNAFVTMID
jgi:hypothetical protein